MTDPPESNQGPPMTPQECADRLRHAAAEFNRMAGFAVRYGLRVQVSVFDQHTPGTGRVPNLAVDVLKVI